METRRTRTRVSVRPQSSQKYLSYQLLVPPFYSLSLSLSTFFVIFLTFSYSLPPPSFHLSPSVLFHSITDTLFSFIFFCHRFNPLNPELNPICYLLALLGAQHFLHVSRIRVKSLALRLLMSYIYIYIYIWSAYS